MIVCCIFIGVRLYLGEEVRVLPDFSIIAARQFHDSDQDSPGSDSSDGLNDGLWCQSANTGDVIGTWNLPNGTQVSTVDDNNFPLHVFHVTGQIGLLRDLGIADYQGLYRCVIPDDNALLKHWSNHYSLKRVAAAGQIKLFKGVNLITPKELW